jgi:hypothetical protein
LSTTVLLQQQQRQHQQLDLLQGQLQLAVPHRS